MLELNNNYKIESHIPTIGSGSCSIIEFEGERFLLDDFCEVEEGRYLETSLVGFGELEQAIDMLIGVKEVADSEYYSRPLFKQISIKSRQEAGAVDTKIYKRNSTGESSFYVLSKYPQNHQMLSMLVDESESLSIDDMLDLALGVAKACKGIAEELKLPITKRIILNMSYCHKSKSAKAFRLYTAIANYRLKHNPLYRYYVQLHEIANDLYKTHKTNDIVEFGKFMIGLSLKCKEVKSDILYDCPRMSTDRIVELCDEAYRNDLNPIIKDLFLHCLNSNSGYRDWSELINDLSQVRCVQSSLNATLIKTKHRFPMIYSLVSRPFKNILKTHP